MIRNSAIALTPLRTFDLVLLLRVALVFLLSTTLVPSPLNSFFLAYGGRRCISTSVFKFPFPF